MGRVVKVREAADLVLAAEAVRRKARHGLDE
jgi:hypothetical protein